METVIKYSDKIYIYEKITEKKVGFETRYSLFVVQDGEPMESDTTSSIDELVEIYKLDREQIKELYIQHFLKAIE